MASTTQTEIFRHKHGEVPKLTTSNYTAWKEAMIFLLKGCNLWTIVDRKELQPTPPIPPAPAPPAQPSGSTNQRNTRGSSTASSSTAQPGPSAEATTTYQKELLEYEKQLLKYEKRVDSAAAIIYSSLTTSAKAYLHGATKPAAMWDSLKRRLDKLANQTGAAHTHLAFIRDKMSETETVSDYISRLIGYKTSLTHTAYTISDQSLVNQLLATLTPKFNGIKRHIYERPIADQTIDYVLSTLREYELQVEEEKAVETTALAVQRSHQNRSHRGQNRNSRGQTRTYQGQNRTHHGQNQDRQDQQDQQDDQGHKERRRRQCYHCLKEGHMAKDCRVRKRGDKLRQRHRNSYNNSSNNSNDNNAESSAKIVKALIHQAKVCVNNKRAWYVDSGATDHMCSSLRFFTQVQKLPKPRKVKVGDEGVILATGIGSVLFRNGLLLQDVLYVPDLGCNLLSVTKSVKAGCRVIFDEACDIINKQNGELLLSAPCINDMYEIPASLTSALPTRSIQQAPSQSATALPARSTNSTADLDLWHRRLGHINKGYVTELAKGLATGMTISATVPATVPITVPTTASTTTPTIAPITSVTTSSSPVCVPCLQGKQQATGINRSPQTRATKPLELIHSDLCGPFPSSHSGHIYFIIFVDDYTRYTWVYMLKSKSSEEICEVFERFKVMVENQSGYRIMRFRCDNGKGEYDNRQFKGILSRSGIIFEPSAPYTQHQNGVGERKIRIIQETVTTMLSEANLRKEFWAEAASTAVYIINRVPTRAVENKTPYEAWFGQPPALHHIRVFGCAAYAHVPKKKRTKLDQKTQRCMLLGYVRSTTKNWRLWDPVGKRVFESSNVVFDESQLGLPILPANSKHESNEMNIDGPVNTESVLAPILAPPQQMMPAGLRAPPRIILGEEIIDEDEPAAAAKTAISGNSRITDCDDNLDCLDSRGDSPRCGLPVADPKTYSEALQGPDARNWKAGMQEEYNSLLENHTWDLVVPPQGKGVIGCKWVYRRKENALNGTTRYKARLVIKGYEQVEGIDYNETFAPVAKMPTLRMLIALAVLLDWDMGQLDFVTAFLNPELEEEVYMEQPEGFIELGKEHLVCRLHKSLYGLKQAPRVWNTEIDSYLLSISFSRCPEDPNLYIYTDSNSAIVLLLLIWVDDVFMIAAKGHMNHVKQKLMAKYKMTDLGEVRKFIGLEMIRDRQNRRLLLHQRTYIQSILEHFGMENCNSVATPLEPNQQLTNGDEILDPDGKRKYLSLVGKLMYAMIGTRPDLAFTVSKLGQFSSSPTAEHARAAKRVLRYLQHTENHGLLFSADSADAGTLVGYSDSDWAGDLDDRKSTSGYVFTLSGAAISWKSRKQATVALSSTEAEYMATTEACKEAMWLRRLYNSLRSKINSTPSVPLAPSTLPEPQLILIDNRGAMDLAKNPKHHDRTKHIEIRHHFIRQVVEDQLITLEHIPTHENTADVLTKALPRDRHEKHVQGMGVMAIE